MTKAMTPKQQCPACGTEPEDDEPRGEYECPQCGLVGFDCCVPGGRGCLCIECEERSE